LQLIHEALFQKFALIKTISKGFVFSDFVKNKLNLVYPDFKINIYANAKNTKVSSDVKQPQLYKQLLLQRDEICNEEHVPIYMVASNKTLIELANYLPDTAVHLLKISGFGEAKVNAYGDAFLKVIKDYMQEHQLESNINALLPKKQRKAGVGKVNSGEKVKKVSTKEQTYTLFKQGLKMEEIAKQRGFALSTVQSHLIPYISSGEIMIDELVSNEKQRLILSKKV
jgi:ribonuclease D